MFVPCFSKSAPWRARTTLCVLLGTYNYHIGGVRHEAPNHRCTRRGDGVGEKPLVVTWRAPFPP